nr:immunoglobulin light chain junction region [Macaca mulatta]
DYHCQSADNSANQYIF